MSDLIRMIQESDDFCAMGAIPPTLLNNAEKELGVVFANDYKEYVLTFGAATFNSRELTGICSSDRLNVVTVTKRARQFYPNFPENAYVVEELMFDHVFIIQDSKGSIFSYGPKDSANLIANSLEGYLFQ